MQTVLLQLRPNTAKAVRILNQELTLDKYIIQQSHQYYCVNNRLNVSNEKMFKCGN